MRAVYYCRVSTDEQTQLNALKDQIEEARRCISDNKWSLAGGYIDEAKSATSTKSRSEYKRLFDDLSADKFDILVIKSQDRLMRNVKDWYIFIDALVSNKKKLFFYLENKFYSPDDALITGIKAILAEEYSRELSKKIRNAHKNRQAQGKSILITSATWGYDKKDKQVVINGSEAEIVRYIYNLSIQGYGSRAISQLLTDKGIKSRTGGIFPETTIRKIIRNPLYKGTVVMNRKTIDFNSKKTVLNPESEWIVHENTVAPIVSSNIWQEANRQMDLRSKLVKSDTKAEKRMGKNIGKHELSGKIYCGICGNAYWQRYKRGYKNKSEIKLSWSCSEYVRRGRKRAEIYNKDIETPSSGCDNIHIKEDELLKVLIKAFDEAAVDNSKEIVESALAIIESIIKNNDESTQYGEIMLEYNKKIKQKNLLMDKLLSRTISDEDYKIKVKEIDDSLINIKVKITELESLIEKLPVNTSERLTKIRHLLEQTAKAEINKKRIISHVSKIIVFPDRLEIDFDFCGRIIFGEFEKLI